MTRSQGAVDNNDNKRDNDDACRNYAIVVDDHPLMARGIAGYLAAHCGFDAALHAADAQACAALTEREGCPALLVVDFWLPDGTAVGLLREAATRLPACKLLVMSADDDARVCIKAREAGAHGFILKNEPPELFATAVASLRQGRRWFQQARPPSARRELPLEPSELGLTARQAEVLGMMLRGLPNKRIALTLSVSEQTVKEHVTAILGKLGVRNRIEALALLHGRRLDS
ncbi:response regulator transcription factor [Cupriavidus taiwanensis]|uniref:Response regulator, NarL-family n=1 Tax=Cupriavidus taiwanensis TaxID=164546 RepID=A0A375BXW9_9BURK|nr:response regulator transcription factor [Cupriavidus taiwanensis]MDK3022219.1 response regulator transcription factor [Cupriavidus taiwanensis]NSX12995.1 response regulator transcription factor [Cupriavidus taiwanensis]SOY57836.1 Response regulator, NarL-family [Cupriavidus taiwanensis]